MNRKETADELALLENLYPMIIPKHDEAHGIITAMLDYPRDREIRIVDLGCGFGGLTRHLLEAFPAGVFFCIDDNLQILHKMREKLSTFSDQIIPIHCNLHSPVWTRDIDRSSAVVSSFALDYLPPARRKQVVEEAYHLLEPGGRWVSCEFYRSHDTRVNRVFHDLEIRYIRTALDDERVTAEQLEQLSSSGILRQEHHIISVDEKVKWLHDAGFEHVDVPWRFLNLAIVSGVKS